MNDIVKFANTFSASATNSLLDAAAQWGSEKTLEQYQSELEAIVKNKPDLPERAFVRCVYLPNDNIIWKRHGYWFCSAGLFNKVHATWLEIPAWQRPCIGFIEDADKATVNGVPLVEFLAKLDFHEWISNKALESYGLPLQPYWIY